MDAPTQSALAEALVRLGCPRDTAASMAAQLDKRATQLAVQSGRTHEAALAHLLQLMAQGWAAAAQPAKTTNATIQPWEKLGRTLLGDHRIFKLYSNRLRSPRTQREMEMFTLDCPDWVNIMALTPEGGVVLVEQYRQGTETVELEIPGGMMDPQDTQPVATAVRELREETGYEGQRARVIGELFANPAIMSNKVYTVLVEDCQCLHAVQWDEGEDMLTRVVPVTDLPRLVREGQIRHSVVIAALHLFALHQAQ